MVWCKMTGDIFKNDKTGNKNSDKNKTPIIVKGTYSQRYNKLCDDIDRFILREFNNEMKELGVCVLTLPTSMGESIAKFQKEMIKYYEKLKK